MKDKENSHYVIIRKLALLLYPKYKSSNKEEICIWCRGKYRVVGGHLERHLMNCKERLSKKELDCDWLNKIKLPKIIDGPIKFKKNYLRKEKFVVYADFESTTILSPCRKRKQIPNFYCLFCPDLLKYTTDDNGIRLLAHQCKDTLMKNFCKDLKEIFSIADELLHKYPQVPKLSKEELEIFESTKKCPLCEEKFTQENPKCIHHDHASGKFISALCKSCNIAIAEPNLKIRVVFHNFKGYDSHFIIRLAVKTFNISEKDQ
ncbi:MAG: endonuclease domain-containing protein [Candidatus Dojkabacteria bacterium]|nr:endonuclease domain-containing protein [Candidatus Dojkabacteria bacterium]